MIASLTLIKTKHEKSPLRTESVIGVLVHPPLLNWPIKLIAEPLDPALSMRMVTTSDVTNIHWDIGGFTAETKNSIYDVRLAATPDEIDVFKNAASIV